MHRQVGHDLVNGIGDPFMPACQKLIVPSHAVQASGRGIIGVFVVIRQFDLVKACVVRPPPAVERLDIAVALGKIRMPVTNCILACIADIAGLV